MNGSDNGSTVGTKQREQAASDRFILRFGRTIEPLVCAPDDDEETRQRKILFALASILIVPFGVLWAILYYAFGERLVALYPLAYSVLTLLNLGLLIRLRRFTLFRRVQQLFILILPVLLQLGLGGIGGASVVIVWSILAVLMAALFADKREAVWWFVAFAVLVAGTLIARPELTIQNNLPEWLVVGLFVLNVLTVSTIVFVVLLAFVTTRTRLRELQAAYLKQDLALRQTEKLATLGTLSAGIAHELNNPAAATRRAAEQLREAFARLEDAQFRLNAVEIDPAGLEILKTMEKEGRRRAAQPDALGALERSDREAAVEAWLDDHEVPDPWEMAPPLVQQGLSPDALDSLADEIDERALVPSLTWLACTFPVYALLHEIGEGSARISEIVRALKSYSFLDRAPLQEVDLHEGLDNTLVILRSKLKQGITVHRDYCSDMPPVPAYGSELNQVWTNLLDNAADALNGQGTITIRTQDSDGWAVVEVDDDGPGIPESIQRSIFDPFFTTKAPGKGTGLGLSTVHRIVVEKHGGEVSVDSRPGRTRFTVRLPYERPPAGAEQEVM